jgi:hypothetical protein
MIVAVHQPNYLPYLGFFDKMRQADVFVIHDDAQFTDSEFIHRNRIRIYNGWKWLTVPVFKEPVAIRDVRIKSDAVNNAPVWSKAHFREICANYKKTPYYDVYARELEEIYQRGYERLIDLNMRLIRVLMKAFDINVELVFSSTLGLESKSTQKLVDIVHAVGGDVYLSGGGGRKYLDESLFKDVKLVYQDFRHPVYEQRYPGFVPNMSAIDALFNTGGMP